MNLTTENFHFKFLTPCFSGTAEGKDSAWSELRVPAIRGHLRFWHRAAFGADSANRIWGSTTGDQGHGSQVAVRLLGGPVRNQHPESILPHDLRKSGKPRPSLPLGTAAHMQLQRLPACTEENWSKAVTAARLWLLCGTLGYRSSRAAGSVWPVADWAPQTQDQLSQSLAPLLKRTVSPWAAALIGDSAGKDPLELRQAASDTVQAKPEVFGSAAPRWPSPVRFKVVELASGCCLLATAADKRTLGAAQTALLRKPKPDRWQSLGPWKPL